MEYGMELAGVLSVFHLMHLEEQRRRHVCYDYGLGFQAHPLFDGRIDLLADRVADELCLYGR